MTNSASNSRHIACMRLQELGPEVVVAALALDRLDDEAGDVVRVVLERPAGGGERIALGGLDVGCCR